MRIGHLDARALDAADPPMRNPHRALGAPVWFPRESKKGWYEGNERNDDLQPANKLVGHVGFATPNKKPAMRRVGDAAFAAILSAKWPNWNPMRAT